MKVINIAIDGPSGAGKSTISREIANRLSYIYIDTGALYRAVGLYFLRSNIPSTDEETVNKLISCIEIDFKHDKEGKQRVFLNGEDVSDEIRTPLASKYASDVSAMGQVRKHLFKLQRSVAAKKNVIMDGRDIGTVVLPNAQIKIFLTASTEERALRRYKELFERGTVVNYNDVLAQMVERDSNDSNRSIAPLKPADDAIIIDTTGNTLEQSIDLIYGKIKEKIKDVL